MSFHAENVLAAIERADTSAVVASWRRCTSLYKLDPDRSAPPERDSSALQAAIARNERLIDVARPYLDQLFALLGDPEGATNLNDRDGVTLLMQSGRSHDVWKQRREKWVGTRFDERHAGTNGVGTALAEERPVTVYGSEHFLAPLGVTVCAGAPIYNADGALAGCLNAMLSLPTATPQFAGVVQALVATFARRITVELFAAAFPRARLVHASAGGRQPCALLAVDPDDAIVGATYSARRLLQLDDARLAEGVDFRTLDEAKDDIAAVERKLIARALARHSGNVSAAAKSIGISRSTFYRKAGDLRRDPM